jgi:glycosyltransferase involved in cell wall biosynthesis
MGGAETYLALIANAHAARGLGSRIVVLSEPGPVSERFAPEVEVEYLGYRRASIRNPLRFLVSVVRGYRLIARAVDRLGIEVLQTHLPDTNLWGLALSLTGRCRVVVTIHNNRFLRGVEERSFRSWAKLRAYRMMFRRCAAIVAVSAEVKKSLLATLGIDGDDADRVVVVDNGVPVPDPVSGDRRREIRARYGIGPDDRWVVAAGRLTEAKNFRCLVAAAALLKDQGRPVRVLIAGEGDLRGDLERQRADLQVEDLVALPGNREDLGEVMQAADLLAMSSRWEGMPMVLLEAMARGLPVVGTRINGLVDVIEEGRQGLLVEVDDAHGLAEAIGRLFAEPETRREMGRNARDLVLEKYDFRRVYQELCRVYDAAAGR